MFSNHRADDAAARPTLDEILEALANLPPVDLDEPAAVTIRRERERR